MKTSLIAATLNEIEAIQVVLPELQEGWVDEIVITDGGSTDGTVEFCKERGVKVVQQTGKGYDSVTEMVSDRADLGADGEDAELVSGCPERDTSTVGSSADAGSSESGRPWCSASSAAWTALPA